ncbi:hypothetical protein BESB_038660 [Besnoitia besnoiti]|uniref:Ribosomal protein RPS6 n=1 Tax=Besnoitia besnoiti TaxID=94643 RepID=A0A2A9MFX6_BESBE|nr:hypothetical protein BESB_038660 [Besnoitia besnoiti]PFH37408.1 hypothetical protein BESB_038660 [Besnoitia besnoiti]
METARRTIRTEGGTGKRGKNADELMLSSVPAEVSRRNPAASAVRSGLLPSSSGASSFGHVPLPLIPTSTCERSSLRVARHPSFVSPSPPRAPVASWCSALCASNFFSPGAAPSICCMPRLQLRGADRGAPLSARSCGCPRRHRGACRPSFFPTEAQSHGLHGETLLEFPSSLDLRSPGPSSALCESHSQRSDSSALAAPRASSSCLCRAIAARSREPNCMRCTTQNGHPPRRGCLPPRAFSAWCLASLCGCFLSFLLAACCLLSHAAFFVLRCRLRPAARRVNSGRAAPPEKSFEGSTQRRGAKAPANAAGRSRRSRCVSSLLLAFSALSASAVAPASARLAAGAPRAAALSLLWSPPAFLRAGCDAQFAPAPPPREVRVVRHAATPRPACLLARAPAGPLPSFESPTGAVPSPSPSSGATPVSASLSARRLPAQGRPCAHPRFSGHFQAPGHRLAAFLSSPAAVWRSGSESTSLLLFVLSPIALLQRAARTHPAFSTTGSRGRQAARPVSAAAAALLAAAAPPMPIAGTCESAVDFRGGKRTSSLWFAFTRLHAAGCQAGGREGRDEARDACSSAYRLEASASRKSSLGAATSVASQARVGATAAKPVHAATHMPEEESEAELDLPRRLLIPKYKLDREAHLRVYQPSVVQGKPLVSVFLVDGNNEALTLRFSGHGLAETRPYRVVSLFRPEMPVPSVKEAIRPYVEQLQKWRCRNLRVTYRGYRRLAYLVKRKDSAHVVEMTFDLIPSAVHYLHVKLNLDDNIIRFMLLKNPPLPRSIVKRRHMIPPEEFEELVRYSGLPETRS